MGRGIFRLEMDKSKQLQKIAREIESCKICHERTSGKSVPGERDPDARVIFIGEAPGREEAKTGRPFIGRSGQLLRRLIREAGFSEADVFITSPVKYLPDRGTPDQVQIAHGRKHLHQQLAVINPKIIVLLGRVACLGVLELSVPILKVHGKILAKDGRKYLVTLHPAAVIRFPKYLPLIQADFRKFKSMLV